MSHDPRHIPVLLQEVLEGLAVKDGGVYLDGTFGFGGYSRAILAAAPACALFAIDRDPQAVERGRALETQFTPRFTIVPGCFGDMAPLLADRGVTGLDGIALDIGVSSAHLDDVERGFSFRFDGPLDMRMSLDGPTAADAVNELPEEELANIIYRYGEERQSRRVAKAIVTARAEAPITRTGQLADLVRGVVRKSKDGIDPATRTFQALRIHVNDELGELERGLAGAETLLKPGGRLAVVSFHSLEDRIVKQFLKDRADTGGGGSRHLPQAAPPRLPTFRLVSRKAIVATENEARANPRARSAKLRIAERLDAPVPVNDQGGGKRCAA